MSGWFQAGVPAGILAGMIKRAHRLIVLAGLLGVLLTGQAAGQAPVAPQQVDVYLLAGQSNMQGLGHVAKTPGPWREAAEGVFFWNGDAFELLDPGATRLSTRAGEFGPELGFARAMRLLRPGRRVYLIKFHRSGQPLHHGWDGGRWVGGDPAAGRRNFYPGEADGDPGVGVHYRDMLAMARAAVDHLRGEGVEPVLRGIVWMQGEADAKHGESAEAYADSLAMLKRRLEEDLESGPVPFVFGQVLPHEPALPRFTHRGLLRERMAQADMRSGDARSIAGVWMVPTEGMPLHADTVHYNTEGQMLLGSAFGLAMLQAQHVLEEAAEPDPAE